MAPHLFEALWPGTTFLLGEFEAEDMSLDLVVAFHLL